MSEVKPQLTSVSHEPIVSSFSNPSGNCVAVYPFEDFVAIFDDNLEGNGGARVVTAAEFDEFETGVQAGSVDSTAILPKKRDGQRDSLRDGRSNGFTDTDLRAWERGLLAGEFGKTALAKVLVQS